MKGKTLGIIAGAGLTLLAGCKPGEAPKRENYDNRDAVIGIRVYVADITSDGVADVIYENPDRHVSAIADDPEVISRAKTLYNGVDDLTPRMTAETREAATQELQAERDLKFAMDRAEYESKGK